MKLQRFILIGICLSGCAGSGLQKQADESTKISAEHRMHNSGLNHQIDYLDENVINQELKIDLPAVLQLAESDSLTVNLAREQYIEAKANKLSAQFKLFPTIQPLILEEQDSGTEFGAAMVWDIDDAVYQSIAAHQRLTSHEERINVFTQTVRTLAVNAFFDLVLARSEREIIEDRLRTSDEILRVAEEREKVGAGLLFDVKIAQADRARVQQQLAETLERERTASLNLTETLHINPVLIVVPQQQADETIDLISIDTQLKDLLETALNQRPELAQSRAELHALETEVNASRFDPWIPSIVGQVFEGENDPRDRGIDAEKYRIGVQWSFGAGGVGDIARQRIANSRLRQEEIRLQSVEDKIAREVIESFTRLNRAHNNIELAKQEVEAAREALRISNERLQNGAGLIIEVLNSEEALFEASYRAAEIMTLYNKTQYELFQRTGGEPAQQSES